MSKYYAVTRTLSPSLCLFCFTFCLPLISSFSFVQHPLQTHKAAFYFFWQMNKLGKSRSRCFHECEKCFLSICVMLKWEKRELPRRCGNQPSNVLRRFFFEFSRKLSRTFSTASIAFPPFSFQC